MQLARLVAALGLLAATSAFSLAPARPARALLSPAASAAVQPSMFFGAKVAAPKKPLKKPVRPVKKAVKKAAKKPVKKPVKRVVAKKPVAKKPVAKKAPPKRAPVRKPVAKNAPVRKPVARKPVSRKPTGATRGARSGEGAQLFAALPGQVAGSVGGFLGSSKAPTAGTNPLLVIGGVGFWAIVALKLILGANSGYA